MKYCNIILLLLFIVILTYLIIKDKESFTKYNGFEYSDKFSKGDIEDLEKGQYILTEMLKDFDSICRNNNIKYWCGAGTLLGIKRHKGWIPFDGDIDLAMTIDEYEKFKKIIYNKLPKKYVFEHYPYNKPCSKIRHLLSHYKYTKGTPNYDTDDGLQLDIFIYKNDSKNKTKIKRDRGRPWNWEKKDIFPLKEAFFEDVKVFVPNNIDLYLTTQYGKNYMIMPKISKRYPHEGRINPNKPSQKMKEKYKESYKKLK